MAKTRSPNYPAISLPDAVAKAKLIYNKERHAPMDHAVALKAMGYTVNGLSVVKLSALKKYGLLEGDSESLRLSEDALTVIHDPSGTPARADAMRRMALKPGLFQELRNQFGAGIPSEENLRSYLLKKKFIPSAASSASRAYRDTMELVEEDSAGYTAPDVPHPANVQEGENMQATTASTRPSAPPPYAVATGMLPPVTFPLPRGNAIEIRLRSKVTAKEFQQVKTLFDLLEASVVEDGGGQES
jgi:hypothetical protein